MLGVLALGLRVTAGEGGVLIVADEFPAMEYVAARFQAEEQLEAKVVSQDRLPRDLTGYRAVIVYIHRDLDPRVERALIRYTREGGRLVGLHHSISSGKRKNREWFSFLGIELPAKEVSEGGYRWIEPATIEVVNLAPKHFITTHKVRWPARVAYRRETGGEEMLLPGVVLEESEVYLNHIFTGARTVLLGVKYREPATGRVWMQDRAGWLRPAGKGWIVYFQPGYSLRDFQEAAYMRLILNAVLFEP